MTDRVTTAVYQPTSGTPQRISVSGLIFANINGDIFIEGSGFDPSLKGFVAHRPYVESVVGVLLNGTPDSGSFNLNIAGKPNFLDNAWPSQVGGEQYDTGFSTHMDSMNHRPSGMSLFIPGPSAVYVYNNGIGHQLVNNSLFTESGGAVVPLNFYIQGVTDLSSGTMPLVVLSPSGQASGSLNLNIGSEYPNNSLNMNVRGR